MLEDGLLHVVDEARYVVCCGAAGVYNKAGVLGGYLSATHTVALEAAFNDERAGVVAFGTLKGAACAWVLERLTA